MSNQGWGRPPRKNKSASEKTFDVVTWPFRKVFGFVLDKLVLKASKK